MVAAVIAYIAHLNGFKTYLMAPTEILAFQHQNTLSRLLSPYGVEVGIYTGSRKKVQMANSKLPMAKKQKTISSHVIVGTHALLSANLQTEDVG